MLTTASMSLNDRASALRPWLTDLFSSFGGTLPKPLASAIRAWQLLTTTAVEPPQAPTVEVGTILAAAEQLANDALAGRADLVAAARPLVVADNSVRRAEIHQQVLEAATNKAASHVLACAYTATPALMTEVIRPRVLDALAVIDANAAVLPETIDDDSAAGSPTEIRSRWDKVTTATDVVVRAVSARAYLRSERLLLAPTVDVIDAFGLCRNPHQITADPRTVNGDYRYSPRPPDDARLHLLQMSRHHAVWWFPLTAEQDEVAAAAADDIKSKILEVQGRPTRGIAVTIG